MATLQKNVAGQNMTFVLVNATTGAGLPGATVNPFVTKDNGAQAVGIGVTTECGNGQYNYAPTQAETNGTDCGFLFTATNAVPSNLDFHTDVVDANGFVQVDVEAIHGVTLAAQALAQSTQSICWGTVGNGSSTTSVVVSVLNNPAATNAPGQLIGRTLIFLGNSTTAALQSSAASITASTASVTPTITVTGLPTSPASGDTFVIV